MGVSPVQFSSGGQNSAHLIPGGYSRNVSLPNGGGGVSIGNICILGQSELGTPKTLLKFSSVAEAKSALSGGELLEGIYDAFNPGDNLVPQQVWAVRIDPATQSITTLKKTGVDKIDLKTKLYGAKASQAQYSLNTGTTVGTKKFSEKFNGQLFEYDNIERKSFDIQYIGAGSAGTMTITGTTLTTTITGAPADNLSLAFATYPTIADLIAYISSLSTYTATVQAGQSSKKSNELDAVTAQDIRTALYTAKSDVQALIETINNSSFWGANLTSGATRDVPDNVAVLTFGTGASNGSAVNGDWIASFLKIEQEDIQGISVMSESATIHALAKAHIQYVNGVEGKAERQAILGADGVSTLANAVTQAKANNEPAICMVYDKFQGFNSEGVEIAKTSMYYASQLLGQMASVDLNVPLTHRIRNVIKQNVVWTKSEKETAISGGVILSETTPQGICRTVRSITTYQADDVKFNEFSSVRQILFMGRDIRTGSERLKVGTPGGGRAVAEILSFLTAKLNQYTERGYLVGDDTHPSFKEQSVTLKADAIFVSWVGNVSLPVNFIFTTNNFSILVQ